MTSRDRERIAERGAPGAAQGRTRLSRDGIAKAALELLCRDPEAPLTMERVATAVNTSPMSLYVHVGSRDGLLDAVAEYFLASFRVDVEPDSPWQKRLRGWVEGVFDQVCACPAPTLLLGRQSMPMLDGWARLNGDLLRCLEGTGLAGLDLACVVRWVGRATISLAILEAAQPNPSGLFAILNRLDRVEDAAAAALLRLLPDLAGTSQSLARRFAADRTVSAIEAFIAERSSADPRARTRRGSLSACSDRQRPPRAAGDRPRADVSVADAPSSPAG